jgi:hypothetical protein
MYKQLVLDILKLVNDMKSTLGKDVIVDDDNFSTHFEKGVTMNSKYNYSYRLKYAQYKEHGDLIYLTSVSFFIFRDDDEVITKYLKMD